MEGVWGRGGRLFEVGANSGLGAYSNKFGKHNIHLLSSAAIGFYREATHT